MNRDELRKLLEQDPKALLDLIEKLFALIKELEQRLHKDSHNSNRPPSSDGLNRLLVFDIPPVTLKITEHVAEYKQCPYCNAVTQASFPEGVTRPVQYGSWIKAFITYLSQYHLIPYETLVVHII